MTKKPFPGRVPADVELAAKKTKDTRKLRWKDDQNKKLAFPQERK